MLFTILRENSSQIAVLSLETGEKKIVIEGGKEARYAPTGHLVYEAAGTGTLMAVAFDLASTEVMGKPVAILDGIRQRQTGAVDYGFSVDGTWFTFQADLLRGKHWSGWIGRERNGW